MRKKATIIILIMILIIQAIMPAKAFIEIREITSTPAQKENQKAKNSVFDEDITFQWEYYEGGDVMPYGLFTPSSAENLESLPLIVWLHGSGEVYKGEGELKWNGLPAALSEWKLEGFSAYVLCPQLTGSWVGSWYDGNANDKLKELLDKFLSEYNVDKENVFLVGHSAGAKGALTITIKMQEYFSKLVVLSGYAVGGLSQITIPTVCYVGSDDAQTCKNDTRNYLAPVFGEENCFEVIANHGSVPRVAFTQDNGSNLRNWTVITVQT